MRAIPFPRMRLRRSATRRERGASLMELALIAPLMVLIVMGVLDLGRAYRMQIRLESAAREGSAYAVLYPGDVTCTTRPGISGRVRGEDGVGSLPDFAMTVLRENAGGDVVVPYTGCGVTGFERGDRIRVETVATMAITTPLVARVVGSSIRLSGSAEVEVQS